MATPSILVVEDEPSMRRLIVYRLSKLYRIREASNGREALERIAEEVPSLIISDVMMPVMDGLSLCAALRQDPRTRAVPFIALTAKGRDEDIERGRQAGVSDYIVKPFEMTFLLERVAGFLC